jgi:hypothetical protein
MTPLVAAGLEGKRRLRKATIGREVPVKAITLKKKNSHLGPNVGIVKLINRNKPPQPIRARIKAAGINAVTRGEEFVSMM